MYLFWGSILLVFLVRENHYRKILLVFLRCHTKNRGKLNENIVYPLEATGYREIFDNAWMADSEFIKCEKFHRYEMMMKSFAEMVRGEKKNPWDYDYEFNLFKTVRKACGM